MGVYNLSGTRIDEQVFVNVKSFGAKGDGTTNDRSSIQNALDSVKNTGGVIYFPVGTYLIQSAILFYSNQTLWFENGATILQGASINNLMRSYCDASWTGYTGTHDCLIYGATFDGGEYTTDNTLVGIAHCKNIIFENCTFKNGYGTWHNLEINSSYNIKVINCIHEGSRRTGDGAEMIQIDYCRDAGLYPWTANYDDTVCNYVEICGCYFSGNTISPAIGNHTNAAHKFASIHDNIFDGLTSTRGAINFVSSMTEIDIYDNTFNGCAKGVGSTGATYYIHDNRFVNTTTAISGSASVAHCNMINGTYTA